MDDDKTFSQWEQTDHANLSVFELTFDDFVDELVSRLQKLTSHHFISKHQSKFFNEVKEQLDENTCLIVLV